MTPFIPALAGALLVAGVIGVVWGLVPAPVRDAAPRRASGMRATVARVQRRTLILVAVATLVGIVVASLTGWLIAIVVIPLGVVGLPVLLTAPPSATSIRKLEALEEWTRGLSSLLTVGVGLEEALRNSLRSTPEPIREDVALLVARLRARMSTEAALRAFADDIDDATVDYVASYLILGSRRRGQGLATVLADLAARVAKDVRGRRDVEADRAKTRTTARWVTIITLIVMGLLLLTGDYVAPYATPLGQLVLSVLLVAYVGLLVWMRNMAKGERMPRFLGTAQGAKA